MSKNRYQWIDELIPLRCPLAGLIWITNTFRGLLIFLLYLTDCELPRRLLCNSNISPLLYLRWIEGFLFRSVNTVVSFDCSWGVLSYPTSWLFPDMAFDYGNCCRKNRLWMNLEKCTFMHWVEYTTRERAKLQLHFRHLSFRGTNNRALFGKTILLSRVSTLTEIVSIGEVVCRRSAYLETHIRQIRAACSSS